MDKVLFTVLNLAIALVVPFASAWFATLTVQRLAERDARKRDARSLFLRINQHAQQYRSAMLMFHRTIFERVPVPAETRERARSTTAHEFWTIHTALNEDILLLHFLFGDAAQPLVDSLHALMSMYEAFDLEKLPDLSGFNEQASDLVHRVADEMNTLWETL